LYNSKPNWFRYDLVWDKSLGVGFLSANKQPLRSHENIYVFSKKGATYYRKDIEGDFPNTNVGPRPKTFHTCKAFGYTEKESNEGKRCVKSVFQFANRKGKGQHPTQKPLDLYKFLIERYSKEGDTVLDPTAGSFNSGLACKELNRNYVGIEMNEGFYTKGVELLSK
jgi:site-specific DNA-methyltransferase (adenine-specific)